MIKVYNDEELEEELKYVMRDTTNTLERMIKDAPAELQKSAVSIDFVKNTIKSVIERYQKSYINIAQKMNGPFKDFSTVEMASKIEEQIKQLEEIYGLEIEGQQIGDFVKQINFSRDDEDERTEEERTDRDDDLMTFMDETIDSLRTLLQLEDIDGDTHELIRNAANQSIEIYRSKYAQLLEQMGAISRNPNVMLKESQIEQIINRLEAQYGRLEEQSDNNKSNEQTANTKQQSRDDGGERTEEARTDRDDDLMTFMDETIDSLRTLLQLEDIDGDTHELIRNAANQSIEIYRSKYAQLLEQMGAISRNPNVMLKESQIEQIINRLEAQYGKLEEQSDNNKSNEQTTNTEQQTSTQNEGVVASSSEQKKKEGTLESKQELLARLQREYPLEGFLDSDPMKEAFENARIKSIQDLLEQFAQKYSLEGIQDTETLYNKLHEMLNDGLDYSCNPNDTERAVRFQLLNHIVPQYSELRSAIITLRGMNPEYEKQLLESVDLSHISYQELLNKANAMIQEIVQPEKPRAKGQSIRDDVEDEFQPQTPSQKPNEQGAQILWLNRLKSSNEAVDRVPGGAQDKREVVQLIQELGQQTRQDKNQQIQEEPNEGQR